MRAACLVVLVFAAGCAVGPNFRRPKPPDASSYNAGGDPTSTITADGRSQRFVAGADVTADWWRLFGSSSIDAVVAHAIARNPNLDAARASLRKSRNELRAGYGAFFPQIDAQAGGIYQQQSLLRFGQNTPPTDFALYTVGGSVTYALDIWGGQRRQVEALAALADAQRWALDGAYVMLCGNVVDALLAQAGYRAQLEATRSIIDLEREQLRVAEAQAAGGTAPYTNVLSIRTQVATSEALVPQLEQKIDQSNHLVTALVGEAPSVWSVPQMTLEDVALPADVPVTLPSKLVRQRPDILVAEATLHAANAQIGVATAAMLPNITLSASGGGNNTSLAELFAPNALFGSVGAGVTAPIFHGGTLWHQRKAAIDARDAAAALYRQTVIGAFQQVADALRALEHDAQALAAQKTAVDSAARASELLQANYRAGVASYIQVIITNEQYIQAKIAYVATVTQRLQDTVSLYVALGGGWWNASPT